MNKFFCLLLSTCKWICVLHAFHQLKAKTELLLSTEAAKASQKANLENSLETAQHALQDKQQVSAFFALLSLIITV